MANVLERKERLDFLLQNAESELRDGLYFEVHGDDLRIVVEALKLAKAALDHAGGQP